MILQGNQRGGSRDLARHLLKDENDHVEVHELRGFVADDLHSALDEVYAISRGTRAKQYLYSLSLNPPLEADVSTEDFKAAIADVEKTLNLENQPRAIVFHEKEGRRHCHAVWSRINAEEMKAIPLPHTKRKLQGISRDLYIKHGWTMPRGFVNSQERNPRNFTMAEWQQAKRNGKDAREVKTALQDAWTISDTQSAFQSALKERGYTLARGDRRGFVALDHRCEIYNVPKWIGIKTKDAKVKINESKSLPSVDDAKASIAKDMQTRLTDLKSEHQKAVDGRKTEIELKRQMLVRQQKLEREALNKRQKQRQCAETLERQKRMRTGFRGLWDRMTGKRRKIREQNELEARQALKRDQIERDALSFSQVKQRRVIQKRMERLDGFSQSKQQSLERDLQQYREIEARKREQFERSHDVRGHSKRNDPSLEL